MIEHYFRPSTAEQALELKQQHGENAVWFSGGSKLNAAPTKTNKTVAISLAALPNKEIKLEAEALHIGAMCKLQAVIDHELTPAAIKDAAGFVYSRHVRNQATLAGEIAAKQDEALVVPALLALDAQLLLANGNKVSVEAYLESSREELILEVIIPNPSLKATTRLVRHSAGNYAVVAAAVALNADGKMQIAIEGMNTLGTNNAKPLRLRDLEGQTLEGEALEKAVAESIFPVADIRGSVEYKRYIAGVLVADLLVECQQLAGRA